MKNPPDLFLGGFFVLFYIIVKYKIYFTTYSAFSGKFCDEPPTNMV